MPRVDSQFSIQTEGLNQLNRSLGKIDKDLKRSSLRHLRDTAGDVARTAGSLAPKGKRPLPPNRKVRLADSFKGAANQRGASVVSHLPQAPVFEYGGTIAPKGTPITINRTQMVGKAVQKDARRIEEEVGNLLDRIARSNGFH